MHFVSHWCGEILILGEEIPSLGEKSPPPPGQRSCHTIETAPQWDQKVTQEVKACSGEEKRTEVVISLLTNKFADRPGQRPSMDAE